MKDNTILKYVFIGMLLAWFIGIVSGILWTTTYYERTTQAPDTPQAVVIEKRVPMSIRELQAFLCEAGHSRYKCAIDGKWGKQTAKALDNWLCDRYYKESKK